VRNAHAARCVVDHDRGLRDVRQPKPARSSTGRLSPPNASVRGYACESDMALRARGTLRSSALAGLP